MDIYDSNTVILSTKLLLHCNKNVLRFTEPSPILGTCTSPSMAAAQELRTMNTTKFLNNEATSIPPMWTALAWWWGLWAPRILQIPLLRNPKGRRLLRVPQFGPKNPAYRGAKISRPHSERVFAGRSGSTTTCEHSQKLTPGLLELKVTGVFTESVPFTAV